MTAALVLFFVGFPALVLYLAHRLPLIEKIGPAIICYGVGLALSLAGVLPVEAKAVQDPLLTLTVPLAIPLMLFPMDLKQWSRLAGKTLLSFALIVASVLIACTVGYLLLRHQVEESWKVAGMFVGVYTGGSPNLNAIGVGLRVKEHVLLLANASDVVVSAAWLFMALGFFQKLLLLFLPPFVGNDNGGAGGAEAKAVEIARYDGIFQRQTLLPLLAALGLSVLIFGLGAGVYTLTPKDFNMAALMLTITTLGILGSLVPRIRSIRMTFQLGQYIILIFCLTVASLVDLEKLLGAAPDILIFAAIAVFGSWLLHLALAALLRIDADTVIMTATAAIMSPPFVPVVASALRNREVVVSGLAAGILGYAIGNYLGFALAQALKMMF
ncbi:MAG: DUF819 family protein [Thermodesulfobacteriota bacterium]